MHRQSDMSSPNGKLVAFPFRRYSLVVAVAAQLGVAQLALAQADATRASSVATAGQAGVPQLSEIIVTAERTSQNLQTTPTSITALSAKDIAQHGFTSVLDVAQVAPSLTILPGGNYSGSSALAYIRGVGQNQFTYAFEPGVGFYVDDVYYGTVYGSIFDLGDISNIQVLRGPQGTLGMNNEGGAILLSTPEPKGDDSGEATLGYGSFHREYLKGEFDVPLIPGKLALRVSGGLNDVNGYVRRIDFACSNPGAAGNLKPAATAAGCQVGTEGGHNTVLLHTALKWWVNDDFTVVMRGDLLDDRSEAGVEDTLIQNSPEPGSPSAQYDQYVALPLYGISASNPAFVTGNPYTSYSTYTNPGTGTTVPPVNNEFFRAISATIDWKALPGVHVKDIIGYQKYESEFANTDGTPLAAGFLEDNKLDHRQFSEELQLSGKLFDDRLEWLTGAYYYSSWGLYGGHIELPNTGIIPPGTPGFPPGGLWGLNFDIDDPTWRRPPQDSSTSSTMSPRSSAPSSAHVTAPTRRASSTTTPTPQRYRRTSSSRLGRSSTRRVRAAAPGTRRYMPRAPELPAILRPMAARSSRSRCSSRNSRTPKPIISKRLLAVCRSVPLGQRIMSPGCSSIVPPPS